MVTAEELEGFKPTRYLARSWALLTRDKGWIKPVLVLTVAMCVPLVGLLGLLGYSAEWARLTAWGVNSAPKQKDVRVGECLKSGWRVFVVGLVFGLVYGLLGSLLRWRGFLTFVWGIALVFLGVATVVAQLRATIYQKIGAGFGLGALWEMIRRDPKGLVRIFGISCVFTAAGWVASQVFQSVVLLNSFGSFAYLRMVYETGYYTAADVAYAVSDILRATAPLLLLFLLVNNFLTVLETLLVDTATGLWMRQFDVARWGGEKDPLPAEALGLPQAQATTYVPAQAAPSAPTAGAADADAAAPVAEPAPAGGFVPRQVPLGSEGESPAEPVAPAPVAEESAVEPATEPTVEPAEPVVPAAEPAPAPEPPAAPDADQIPQPRTDAQPSEDDPSASA